MATFTSRKNKDGSLSYRAVIRCKGIDISKTFSTEEDAKLYAFFKERLTQNMENFEVSLKDTLTIESLLELKIKSTDQSNHRTINDLNNTKARLLDCFGSKILLSQLTFQDWLEAAKKLSKIEVSRGGPQSKTKNIISLKSLRKIFAYASASISDAIALSIPLENHPLKVIQTYINPMQNKDVED